MPNENETVVEVQTYNPTEGHGNPLAKVGIKTHDQGLTINLPAGVEFGPNVYIERLPSGFQISISPGDGQEIRVSVVVNDNGSMTVRDGEGTFVIEEESAADKQIQALVSLARGGTSEDVLDDLVHDAAQEGNLGKLNAEENEEGQETIIAGGEKSASEINNGGFESQIRYLIENGVEAATIEAALRGK